MLLRPIKRNRRRKIDHWRFREGTKISMMLIGIIITLNSAVTLILMIIIFQGCQSDPLDIGITMVGQARRVSKTLLEGL